MAESGVETVRVAFRWFQLQPATGRVRPRRRRRGRRRGRAARPPGPARDRADAGVGGDAAGRSDLRPRRSGDRAGVRRRARRALRPGGHVLGRAPGAAAAAAPPVAGLQRAQPHGLLVRAALRAELRRDAARGGGGDPRRRSRRHDRARRADEPQLAGVAPALQGGRARELRRRRTAPLHAPGGGRAAARPLRPPGHAGERGRRAPGLDHRALVAGGAGSAARGPRDRDRGERGGAGGAAGPGAAAAREGAQAPEHREGALVHVALERGRAEPVRLVRPAAAARRRRGLDAGARGLPPSRRAGSRAAARRPTPAAAPSPPPRRARPRRPRAPSRPS